METIPPPLLFTGVAIGVAVVPVLFFLVTPFIKLSIVFGVLRTGFGSQGIPGNAALGALSIVLSLHIFGPIAAEMLTGVPELVRELSKRGAAVETILQRQSAPLQRYLMKHSGHEEIEFFSKGRSRESLAVLIPSFVLSELRSAFQMALYLFLPFFAIDLIVTTVLTGMGMMMVNPVTLSFPLKLLLFVECDGWLKLSQGLVAHYQ